MMLNMVKGCWIPDPSLLEEGYQRTETGFTANVNAEKIQSLVEQFISLQEDWVFLILEVPTNIQDEILNEAGECEVLYKDVFYLDGLQKGDAITTLRNFAELFIHDGMSQFGFGSHRGGNEIMIGKYNVASIYTKTPERYDGLFESHGIPEVSELKTAWNYFTQDTYGECWKVPYRGKDIYDAVEHLKKYGLYFAERR